MTKDDIHALLEEKYKTYNRPDFIENDPISIPHQFTVLQDIEITAFWSSMLAWGQRKTIIKKCTDLFERMDNSPYDFVVNHEEKDLNKLIDFKHRTFNQTDTLYFIHFLKHFYQTHTSLEEAFLKGYQEGNIKNAIIGFHDLFFSLEEAPSRTKKHIATPSRKSACKRINMFLRWMVRKDSQHVDFGLWQRINTADLVCPCDVHVDRVARILGLLQRKQTDWQAAVELTNQLKAFDKEDPVKYDFALFGLGLENYFGL